MAIVKIFLRSDRVNGKNEHPLRIRITKNRKSKCINLGIHLLPEHWDKGKQRVKKAHPNATRYNAFIAKKAAEAEGIAVELETQSKYINTYKIKESLMGRAIGEFFPYADKFVNSFQNTGRIGTYRRAKSVIQKLRQFVNGKTLLFDMITVSFLKEYETYLAEKLLNRQNTIHANMRIIRTIINNAIKEDLLPLELNPFMKFKLKTEKTQRAHLTEEELDKIDSLHLDASSNMNHHRNAYVFAAYCCGLRISDVLQLRWKNFDGEKITIKIHKTQSTLSMKLPRRALEILHFYKSEECTSNDFIFPLLKISSDEKNPRVIHNAISSATAYTNKSLLKLALLAGIEKHISFHTARHTWAIRALNKGMHLLYVSQLLGHTAIKESQPYLKILNKDLDRAMEVFN